MHLTIGASIALYTTLAGNHLLDCTDLNCLYDDHNVVL